MSTVTKPIILDETGQRIATALETLAQNGGGSSGGTSNSSPYVITNVDLVELIKGKYFDVDAMVTLIDKYDLLTEIIVENNEEYGLFFENENISEKIISFKSDTCAGGLVLKIMGLGTFVVDSSITTARDALLSAKTQIEQYPATDSFNYPTMIGISISVVREDGANFGRQYITYEDIMTLYKSQL